MVSEAFLTVDGDRISWTQALKYLEASNKLSALVGDILQQYILEKELQSRLVAIEPDEVERAVQTFRGDQDLRDPQRFMEWLQDNGLDKESFYDQTRFRLSVEELKRQVCQPRLREYFIERKLFLDQVVLSRVTLADRELAEELRIQILEGTRLEDIAWEYSLSDDRISNGMMGSVNRGDLPDAVRAAVDVAQPGELIGPVAVDDSSAGKPALRRWLLLRVERFLPAIFDDVAVQTRLQDELFTQWLLEKMQWMEIQLQMGEEKQGDV